MARPGLCASLLPTRLPSSSDFGCSFCWASLLLSRRQSGTECSTTPHTRPRGSWKNKRARLPAPSFQFRRSGFRPWLRHDADIGLRRLPTGGIELLGFVVGDGATENHVFALLPVRRGRNAVFGGEL